MHEIDKHAERFPSVSVCIVTYNSAADIGHCLERVMLQTWPTVSVVVVDNASADETMSITEKYTGVNIIKNVENRGFAAAQNQAIQALKSDYVLVLNPDVALEPNYIKELVTCMEADAEIGSATGSLMMASSPDLLDSAGLEMKWNRKAVERGVGESSSHYAEAGEVFGVSGAAAMYSRRMIDRISIGGEFFDEQYFAYKEDVDAAWRARVLGWKAWYEPAAKALHVRQWGKRSDRKSMPLFIRRHSYQNRYLTIIKNETFSLRWWLKLPGLFLYEMLRHGYLLLCDPKVLGCWQALFRLFADALRKRKIIRQKRIVFLRERGASSSEFPSSYQL